MLSINEKEYIFIEKFRPKTIDDIVLTENIKQKIKSWIKDGQIPNLILTSKSAGLGKTSLAHVLINELDAEALFINASLESNIDLVRTKIKGFASTASYDGRAKIVILDESDFLNANSAQPALRGFIEEFSQNCRFILTCNYKEKIIEPIRNRLQEIDFDEIFNTNKSELVKSTAKRIIEILKYEKIEFSKEDLLFLIKHYYPSQRSIISKIQEFTVFGDQNKLVINKSDIDTDKINTLILESIEKNNFSKIKENIEKLADPSSLYTNLYNNIESFILQKRPEIIIIIAEYSLWDTQVRDRVINAVACGVKIGSIINK